MALEFLEHVAARIAACGDREDLEQARDRRARAPGVRHLAVIGRLGVEKFESQEGAHALVERLFVVDWRQFGHGLGPGVEG